MKPEVFAACREFHLSHGEAAYSRLLKLAPPDVSATLWSNYQYGLYLDAVNAGACRHGVLHGGQCEQCAHEAGEAARIAKRDEDGPPDADHELWNTARERDERAWDEKRSLR